VFGRDVASGPLRVLVVATSAVSVIGLFALVLAVTEVMNVLPAFYFDINSWPQALIFVLVVAIWYWVSWFVVAPRSLRSPSPSRAAAWAVTGVHLLLLFAVVHVLNNLVFVHGILISVWSEIDYVLICHGLVWLLWRRTGRRSSPRRPSLRRAS
jgi:hypothetical protein